MASKNARNFEFKLGKQAFVLFILGMAVLLFSVFLFGVMVGKHLDAYPEMIARDIPDMIRKKLGFGREKARTELAAQREREASADAGEEEFDLTFYETLTKKGVAKNETAHRVKPETQAPSGLVPRALPGALPADQAGNEPEAGSVKQGAAGAAGVAARASGPEMVLDPGHGGTGSATPGKGYVIHVASFRDKGKADQLVKKLDALGYACSLQKRDVAGKGRWFRIVLNDFKTRAEAQKALDAIGARIGGLKATILSVDEKKD